MKSARILCAAAAVCALTLLCACQKIPNETVHGSVSGTKSQEVTAPALPTAPSGESAQSSGSLTLSTVSDTTDSSGITEASETESSVPDVSEVTEDTAVSLPPARELVLPEDFDAKVAEIMEKYSCNRSCNPDSLPCGCMPEREAVTDKDGNVITPRDRVVSIYFLDLESGFEYTLNGSVHYPVASTIKIPFAVYLYEKLDSGEIDPETVLTYEKRHYFGGTGVIVNGEFGQQYTVAELLKLAITRSDNVAYEMLKDLTTWADFEAYLRAGGMTHDEDVRKSKQKICTQAAGVDGRLLAGYLTGGGASVEAFKADLLATRIKMIRSHYPVYRKYGWTNFSFHDIAYVEAPHPYVLAILTNLDSGDDEVLAMFRELSYLFEGLGNPEGME